MLATKILDAFGQVGVVALQQAVDKVSATQKTKASLRYEVESDGTSDTLIIYGRAFFKAIETGRGPRVSSEQGNFKDNMYEWMVARGIGTDLPEKKRRQLARFFTYKINKEGDRTFKMGGREVYSDMLDKLVEEISKAVTEEAIGFYIKEITR